MFDYMKMLEETTSITEKQKNEIQDLICWSESEAMQAKRAQDAALEATLTGLAKALDLALGKIAVAHEVAEDIFNKEEQEILYYLSQTEDPEAYDV